MIKIFKLIIILNILTLSTLFSQNLSTLNLTNEEIQYLENKQFITVCVKEGLLPYESIENNKFIGLSSDFLNLFTSKLSVPLKIITAKNQIESMKLLKTGRCDIKPLLGIHAKTNIPYTVTNAYFNDSIALITRIEQPYIHNLYKLNQTILVSKGFNRFNKFIKKEYPLIKFKEVKDIATGLALVASGEAFGYLGISLTSSYCIQKEYSSKLKIVNDFKEFEFGFGVLNSEPLLLNILNKSINATSQIEQDKVINKWVRITVEKQKNYSLFVLFIFILLIILYFLIKQRRLNKEIEILNITLKNKVTNQIKEIQKSGVLFETIFETVKDGIAILDLESNFLLVNKSYERITGLSKQELYQTSSIELTIPKMKEEAKRVFSTIVERGYYGGYIKQNLFQNKRIVDVRLDFMLMPDQKSILLITKDITIENKLKKEKEFQNQQMLHQSRLAQMGEMISMIAHQWRQPLNAISLTANNLLFKCMMDDINSDYFEKEIRLIDNYSQHLSKTIDDFRGFFREDKVKQITSLEEIISSTLDIIKVSIENKNINIVTLFKSKVELETYPNEVKQVILNIMKNAEDVLLDNKIVNPTITIETVFDEDSKKKILIIKDNAGGIPLDIIESVFNPYFSTKLEKDGTGLGLYMSKTIIEEHCGGKLSVSNDTQGAVFKIEFE